MCYAILRKVILQDPRFPVVSGFGLLTNLKNELNYIILIHYPEKRIPRVLSGARFLSPRRLSEPERRLHRQSFRHSFFMSHDFTFNQPDQSIGRSFAF